MEYGLKPLGREKFWLCAFFSPTLIGLLFDALGSVIATVILSFAKWDLLTPPTWAGVANYINLFNDEKLLLSLSNTIKFTALYVPGVVVISLFVAVLMNRKIRGVSLFRTAYFLPAVTSAVATALVWNMIYGRDTGILNFLLERFPREYYEAAEMDGANGFHQFFRITLPLVTPSIFFQTLISTINAFQAYDYIYMLTRRGQGDSSVPVVVFSIYRNAWNFFNYGGASAQAIELTIIVAVLMAFYFWLERRYVVYE
jgi:multiple sugar transport system permease protein